MNKKITLLFVLSNLIAVILIIFYFDRLQIFKISTPLIYFLTGAFLLGIYGLFGSFEKVIRKSRFKEINGAFNQSILIIVLLFIVDYFWLGNQLDKENITKIIKLGLLHFFVIVTVRLLFLTVIKRLLQKKILGFNTVIVGNNQKAVELFNEIDVLKKSLGFNIIGFITLEDHDSLNKIERLPNLGNSKNLKDIITKNNVEEVIIAIETSQHHQLKSILDKVENTSAIIHIIPDMFDIVTGFVKVNYLFSIPLITLHEDDMPLWQRYLKMAIDYVLSLAVLLCLSPLLVAIAILVKTTTKGPIIYKQERIGKNGKSFTIYKFRTMVRNAEKNGPQLSSLHDGRITKVGKLLRKLRLDELPQFINVLKGEMSIVGPRPERDFYIKQIMEKAPHYHYLQKVLPGITSWGQVKYGYAENVDQMIKRLTFDIIYLENRSLALDLKIMFYTFIIILQRRGK